MFQRARVPRAGKLRGIARYFGDSRASIGGKAFVLLAVAYVVMPIDLIPDVAPIVGWLDDIGVATMAMLFLGKVAERYRDEVALAPAPAPVPIPFSQVSRRIGG